MTQQDPMIATWLYRLALIAGLCALTSAAQAQRDSARTYFFGNSLVYHLGEQEPVHLTSVPYWVDALAKADGRSFATEGQWGFLRNFARDLPPKPNWSFPGVTDAWPNHGSPFLMQDFDGVVITPANFIQFQTAEAPYPDATAGESPFSAMLQVLDYVRTVRPGTRLYLYEGWADLGPVAGFPPDPVGFERYLAINAFDHPAWYDRLEESFARARPSWVLGRIPVSRVLAALLSDGGALEGLDPTVLFTDASPHGSSAMYLIAGAVTYATLFQADPPPDWVPPPQIDPTVARAWPDIAATVSAIVHGGSAPDTGAGAAIAPAAPAPTPEPAAPVAIAPDDEDLPPPAPLAQPRPVGLPALGFGTGTPNDYNTQRPFIDEMKSSRPFVGHTADRWGAFSTRDLIEGGHLSARGWPLSIPPEATALESVLFADLPADARHMRGDYVVLYEGTGTLRVTGRASRIRQEPGRILFTFAPGAGVTGLAISSMDPADPIRNIRVIKTDYLQLYAAGEIFNPDWIPVVEDVRVLRFMTWMMTNGSVLSSWDDRPRLEDATWADHGVPHEVMIELANRVGVDPWFTLPHLADDTYVRNFARAVRDGLDPRLKAYVEYSNEVWNWIFSQAHWSRDQAQALWGAAADGWVQYYGLRAAQVADIWTAEFGAEAPDRLVRVVATHTGWMGLEESILRAPLALLTLGRLPQDSFDAYAVTGYFGHEWGGEDMAPRLAALLDSAEAAAAAEGEAQGLRRVALRDYVETRRFDAALAEATRVIAEGSVRELVEEIFPYHARVADQAGLDLIMYEGGNHLAARDSVLDNVRATDFFAYHAYTPEMSSLYRTVLEGWVAAGGTLFNAFVDVAPTSKWGNWGALRHLSDANPRYDILMAYNATAPSDWEVRDLDAFANGVTLAAPPEGATLTGTPAEDVLAGGVGPDILISLGGDDKLGGGPGEDLAILPGRYEDYAFDRPVAGVVTARAPQGTVRMVGIERIGFAGGTDNVILPLAQIP